MIAGPNGGGKSSLLGELLREFGHKYFDPDDRTERLVAANSGLSRGDANEIAWEEGRRGLESASAKRERFALETTLGGRTITRLLHRAADAGMAVKVWYIALDTADRHVARVRARVGRGGHDVPEARVRERYDASRANLARLVPKLTALKVYDNSIEAFPGARPRLVLDFADGRVMNRDGLADTPPWAKAIVAAALKAERLP